MRACNTSFAVIAAAVLVSAPSLARSQEIAFGELTITEPYVRAMPSSAKVGAGYLKIQNAGVAGDRLISVSSPVARSVEVHSSTTEDGVMRMRHLQAGLQVPPGAVTALAPGGLHLMFIEPRAPFKAGETIPATLLFEKAGPIDVTFLVRPLGK